MGFEVMFPKVIPKDGIPNANRFLVLLENGFDGPMPLLEYDKEV